MDFFLKIVIDVIEINEWTSLLNIIGIDNFKLSLVCSIVTSVLQLVM